MPPFVPIVLTAIHLAGECRTEVAAMIVRNLSGCPHHNSYEADVVADGSEPTSITFRDQDGTTIRPSMIGNPTAVLLQRLTDDVRVEFQLGLDANLESVRLAD